MLSHTGVILLVRTTPVLVLLTTGAGLACEVVSTAGWAYWLHLGCGEAQECTTGTSRQHCSRSLHALWNLFPFLDPLFYHCFSCLFFSQVNDPTLVTFDLVGCIPQGQMGFSGSINLEMVSSCRLRSKASPFFDAWSQTLLTSVFVKASRKWLIFFFHSLQKPPLDYIPVSCVGQIFHKIVYSSFLVLFHAVNPCVISDSSRWSTEQRKRLKLQEEHSAVLLLSHACGTAKNNS